MPDTLRAALAFPVGMIVLLLLAIAVWRSAGWLAINLFVTVFMRPGVRYTDWRWDIVRRWVMDRDHNECRKCGARFRLLHVHHKTFVSQGGGHWTWNLETLCHRCHASRHPHMERE